MKRSTLKFFLSMAAAMGLGASSYGDLLYTFSTSVNPDPVQGGGFNGGSYAWDSTMQAYQATQTAGGWNLGGTGPKFEFTYPAQTTMAGLANTYGGTGTLSFDIIINDNSLLFWNNTASTFLQIWMAGNSDGTQGWTQNQVVNTSYDGISSFNQTYHVSLSFAQVGWQAGDSWFQIFFGSNSDAANAVQFYIDNISVTPEPTSLALAGLGVAALLALRRRS